MERSKQRAITYSLLAHIREKGALISGPIDVFVPLIKKTLAKMNIESRYSGKSIYEIKTVADDNYGIDFPIPVLREVLKKIAYEINKEDQKKLLLHQDDSFQIMNYTFSEFDDTLQIQIAEIENLERLFSEFCINSDLKANDSTSIINFIEKNKLSLSKYLANRQDKNHSDYSIEARFVQFFKRIPSVYDLIKRIYLGSILSSYLEYKTEEVKTNIELLLDTNFVLGVLDLNTPESTHTCNKIIEIATRQGYLLRVLSDTIIETISLLKAKALNFDSSFLTKKVYPEDIYNACERRSLKQSDIERIADHLDGLLSQHGIIKIVETSTYRNIAKFSNEYRYLLQNRNSPASALHDATAIHYVRSKRGKRIKDFENVNCWFIINPINRQKFENIESETSRESFQPEMIKADEFLNILWLSNPQINCNINLNDISDIGLSALISITLSESLPKAAIIQELDDNIQKYSQEGVITDTDIIRIATRIATKQLTNIEELNLLAKEHKEKFVKRLNEEAKKQKEIEDQRVDKMNKTLEQFSKEAEKLSILRIDLEGKSLKLDDKIQKLEGENSSKDDIIKELKEKLAKEKESQRINENKRREIARIEFIDKKVRQWRAKTIWELTGFFIFFLATIFWLLNSCDWSLTQAQVKFRELSTNIIISSVLSLVGIILSSIFLNSLFSKYRDYSNIEAFKRSIRIPDDLQDQ